MSNELNTPMEGDANKEIQQEAPPGKKYNKYGKLVNIRRGAPKKIKEESPPEGEQPQPKTTKQKGDGDEKNDQQQDRGVVVGRENKMKGVDVATLIERQMEISNKILEKIDIIEDKLESLNNRVETMNPMVIDIKERAVSLMDSNTLIYLNSLKATGLAEDISKRLDEKELVAITKRKILPAKPADAAIIELDDLKVCIDQTRQLILNPLTCARVLLTIYMLICFDFPIATTSKLSKDIIINHEFDKPFFPPSIDQSEFSSEKMDKLNQFYSLIKHDFITLQNNFKSDTKLVSFGDRSTINTNLKKVFDGLKVSKGLDWSADVLRESSL